MTTMKTIADVATITRMSQQWVRKAAAAGRIPSTRVGRYRRFSDADIAAIQAGAADPTNPVALRPRNRRRVA